MHPRACVSGISTFRLDLDADLEFWSRHGIDTVGVSVAKCEATGWAAAEVTLARAVDAGLRIADLIGLGAFDLARPETWARGRDRALRAVEAAARLGVPRTVFTTGRFAPLTGEAAADAFAEAIAPVVAEARRLDVGFAIEHTNSLRPDIGFVHSLGDAIDLARRLDIGVCMEVNACWAERDLAGTIARGIDRIALVQISDFRIGTVTSSQRLVPGDGDIPLVRILEDLVACGYPGVFELELIGDAIAEEGYDAAVPRAVAWLDRALAGLGIEPVRPT
ncbi:MAG: sugar phosphate isomerase/epimerase family protein [Actinomycetota bacterium]